jgi:hypothetical protein
MFGKVSPGPEGSLYLSGDSLYIYGGTAPLPQEVELEYPPYTPPAMASKVLKMTGTTVETLGGSADPDKPALYRYSTISMSGGTIKVTGHVAMYVDGDFSMTSKACMDLAPGATLKLYHGSGALKLAGQGVVNHDQEPANFVVKSSTTGTVTLAGTSDFYGAIYAARANCSLMGTSDTYGAVVGSFLTCGGTADFHYDEALGLIPGERVKYTIKAWEQRR